MSKTGSKINGSMTRGGLYESEPQRLQRETDNLTKEVEGQRRKVAKLDGEIEKESTTLREYKDMLRKNRPSTKEQKQKAANNKRMENQLEKEVVKYNEIVSENKGLRGSIDKYRKDRKAAEEIYTKQVKQQQAIELSTMQVTKERNKERTEIEDATMSTILIKSTYGKKKEEYNRNIEELKANLKSKVEKQKGDEWLEKKGAEKIDKDQSNPVDIVKMRLENWKVKVTHKKETLDMYMKHINIIRDAFDQIRKATGISNIQEIVVTFIKSQEQADALNNQLNSLDQELDNLEEKKANITKELQLTYKMIEESHTKNEDLALSLTKQRDALLNSINMKDTELKRVKEIITNIQEPVSRMIKKFRTSKITLSVAEGKLYDETTTFNEQNVKEYLAEVEEYIKCLLTVMADQFGTRYPILMSLGLDELPKKIEPPVFPRENFANTDDDEEPDEQTYNDMLDKTKFDSMMKEILGKHKETSKMVGEESKAMEDEPRSVDRSRSPKHDEKKVNEEDEGLAADLAGEHIADDVAAEEENEAKEENKEEGEGDEPVPNEPAADAEEKREE